MDAGAGQGAAFTTEVEEARETVYAVLAATMKTTAAGTPVAA